MQTDGEQKSRNWRGCFFFKAKGWCYFAEVGVPSKTLNRSRHIFFFFLIRKSAFLIVEEFHLRTTVLKYPQVFFCRRRPPLQLDHVIESHTHAHTPWRCLSFNGLYVCEQERKLVKYGNSTAPALFRTGLLCFVLLFSK